jgi:hypothetical protein
MSIRNIGVALGLVMAMWLPAGADEGDENDGWCVPLVSWTPLPVQTQLCPTTDDPFLCRPTAVYTPVTFECDAPVNGVCNGARGEYPYHEACDFRRGQYYTIDTLNTGGAWGCSPGWPNGYARFRAQVRYVEEHFDDVCVFQRRGSRNTVEVATQGDPHLSTFDGLYYDFHGIGEYWLVYGTDVEIQVRQGKWNEEDAFAGNTAVAMRVGTDRVAVYGTGAYPFFVNGVGMLQSVVLSSGALVELLDDRVVVSWPAGEPSR